ncbi:hypothetical protein GOODEAATRI_033444, partial [Goodea atripinnis]
EKGLQSHMTTMSSWLANWHLCQSIGILKAPQSSVTMVRVVTSAPPSSTPPNGYSTLTVGGMETSGDIWNSDIRGKVRGIC